MSKEVVTITDELQAGKAIATFTQGSSMEPLLYADKTHVIIEPVQDRLSIGDLPLFKRKNGTYVIHRVIEVGNDDYLVRGDNCLNAERISDEQVLGVVTEIYRYGKNIHLTDPGYRRYVNLLQATEFIRLPLYRLRDKVRHARKQRRHMNQQTLQS